MNDFVFCVLYFVFAFVPLYLAYSATLINPDLVKKYLDTDPQMILPKLILNHAPIFAQVMFLVTSPLFWRDLLATKIKKYWSGYFAFDVWKYC